MTSQYLMKYLLIVDTERSLTCHLISDNYSRLSPVAHFSPRQVTQSRPVPHHGSSKYLQPADVLQLWLLQPDQEPGLPSLAPSRLQFQQRLLHHQHWLQLLQLHLQLGQRLLQPGLPHPRDPQEENLWTVPGGIQNSQQVGGCFPAISGGRDPAAGEDTQLS